MDLHLYNSLSKGKEKFIPKEKGNVNIYSCGPTVYNTPHIGNLRNFIIVDFMKSTFKLNKYKINHIMNITDVGHLVSDSDEGEDKIKLASKKEKINVWDIAKKYTDIFKKNLKELNIELPNKFPKATDHIKEQILMIKKLEEKEYAYSAGGNVYFDTSKVKYGKLGGIVEDSKSRVGLDLNKKNKHDFVLWFTKSKFDDQDMKWDSPWGEGYPGWHIECSAMASKYLGKNIDIHTGGEDLLPIHHNNEICQSEAYYGINRWVNYWTHISFLNINSEKMSKSKNNFVTLEDIKQSDYSPLDFRYYCLGTHYRKNMNFTDDGIKSAKLSRKNLIEQYVKLDDIKKDNLYETYIDEIKESLLDDFNFPKALGIMNLSLNNEKTSEFDKKKIIEFIDDLFKLGIRESVKIPKEIMDKIKMRDKFRLNRKFQEADKIREDLEKNNYIIMDEIEKTYVYKKN